MPARRGPSAVRGSGSWKRRARKARSAGARVRVAAAQHQEAEERVADRAADPDPVARAGAAAADLGARDDLADRGQGEHRRPRCRNRIAAQEIDAEAGLVFGEARGKARHPIVAERRRQCRRQEVMQRPRAHRGEVGQVDPQQLLCDEVGRIVRQIVHALDDRIDGDDEAMPGRAIDERRVVLEAEPARPGERGKKSPDAAELAEALAARHSGR